MDARTFTRDGIMELYVTASPATDDPADTPRIFDETARLLRQTGARPFQERLFVTPGAVDSVLAARLSAYRNLDDGMPPVCLQVQPGAREGLVGLQLHAVSAPLDLLRLDDGNYARIARRNGTSFVYATGLAAPEAGDAPEQARRMLAGARQLLQQAGGDMTDVARTWMWLGDILSWYGPFNEVRTAFFNECGMLGGSLQDRRLPASTGIGIGPARAGICTMDFVAVLGKHDGIQYHTQCGRQRSAYNYGSAFSRAASAPTPTGTAVYVSGTAAINGAGETVHLNDAEAQTQDTIDNIRAVLNDLGCTDDDVVQAIVYCKTPRIERQFLARPARLPWPHFSTVAPVCRDNLLVEIEATAFRKD